MDAKFVIPMFLTLFVAVSGSCYSLGTRLGTLEEGQKGTNQRLTDFGRQVDRIESANVRLESYVRRLEVSVGDLERDVRRLDAGATTIGGLEGRLVALQADHKGLQGSLDGLKSAPSSFSEDIRNQLKRIEDRLNEVAVKIGVPVKGTW